MALLRRFLTNDVFVPIYFAEVLRLCNTTFHPSEINPLFDQMLSGWGNGPTTVTIETMKTFANNRRSVVLSLIPTNLTVGTTLSTVSGFLQSTAPTATLFGSSHAVDTRKCTRQWRRGCALCLGSALDEHRLAHPRHQPRDRAVDQLQWRRVRPRHGGHLV